MRRITRIAAAWLTLVAIPAIGLAASPVLEGVIARGELRVGMAGDQMPLNGIDKNGRPGGFEPELAEKLAETMGVSLRIVRIPFPELLPALKKGELDMVMSGLTITPQRNLEFAFAGPYFISGKSLLTRSRELAIAEDETLAENEKLRLVALKSSTSADFAKKRMPRAQLVLTDDVRKGVAMVREGKVDAMVADMPFCVVAVLRHPELATRTIPLTLEPIGIAVPGNDPLLVNLLENYLETISASGELEALNRKWLRRDDWLQDFP